MLTKKLERVVKHTINKLGKRGYTVDRTHADFNFQAKKFKLEELTALVSHPTHINNLYKTFGLDKNYRSNQIFVSHTNDMPNKFNLKLYSKFCNDSKDKINQFVKLRERFENALICSEFPTAKLILDEIDDCFGVTLWSYDSRMSLYTLSRDEDALEILLNKSQELSIGHIANVLKKKHLSTTLNTYLRQVLEKLLSEYRGNNQSEYIDFVSFILVHYEHDRERDLNNILAYIQQFGFIDRYVYYKMIVSEHLCYVETESYDDDIVDFVKEMSALNIEYFWERSADIIADEYHMKNGEIKHDEIIRSYSEGNYSKALSLCKKSLVSHPSNLTLFEISAKSGHYLTGSDELEMDAYARIENIETNSLVVRILVRLCILFEQSSIYEPTLDEINTIIFKYRCIDKLNPLTSLVYTAYPYVNEHKVLSASKEFYLYNETITNKYYSILKNKDPFKGKVSDYIIDEDENILLSESRRLRLDIESQLSENNLEGIHGKLKIMEGFSDITKPEFYHLISLYYIKSNNLEGLIKIIAEECVSHPDNIRLFPIRKVIYEIENDDSDGPYRSNINSVVCCYIYMSMFDNTMKEMVSEVFEDYLSNDGFITPSEKISSSRSISKVETFFYANICTKDIMSILLTIDNNKKLIIERLKVINALSSKFEYQTESLLNEESDLVEEVLYKKVVDHHESNKISIDVEAISKANFEEYRLFLLELCLLSNEDKYILSHFNKFYPAVLEDFIFNKSYGLVRYLSSEIRHGVLPNQIRSVLEAYNIITELGDGDVYERNIYWRDYLSEIANDNFVDDVDYKLAEFSKSCDSLITMANSWPNVSSDKNDNISVFNYSYNKETIERFRTVVLAEFDLARIYDSSPTNNDVDSLLKICEKFIWEETEHHFLLMKKNLNQILKPEFSKLFSDFISQISHCSNLVEQCRICRGKVIEEISLIETWFKKPSKGISEKYNLNEILLAARHCFESIHAPKRINIELSGNYENSKLKLNSSQTLSLTRSIISMCQNSLIHGIVNDQSPIVINASVFEDVTLTIVNEVSENTKKRIISSEQITKVDRFALEDNEKKLISEGGTGLYKTYRFITDIFPSGSFKVELDGNLFHQIVRVGHL
ncbi:hypothetical protein BCU40_005245 [Vibrio lentus]|uniref:hypothetical protein n=1 Tax=Vibrio lentus TaxID=136468 RepID=UPI000C85F014|nr:hypothetical protein [Vibrio lentus]PMI64718.1 hypothetical protein BCU40_17325 [Vibrio lentus]